jgi:hypothetical protein
VSVQASKSSIKRGQNAAFVVAVSTENGSATGVTVTLTAQPASQTPTFTSGCAKGDTTATCNVGSVSASQPVDLQAQIPVAADATSVSSVQLTATASVVTTLTWTQPSAAQSVAVTAASATAAAASPAKSSSSASGTPAAVLPLGPLPDLNNVSSSLIGAGNVAGLFPAISPSASPSPSPGTQAQRGRQNGDAAPVSDTSALAPVLSAQIAGLIALAVAIFLTVTRLSLRRRVRPDKSGS